MSFSNWHRYVIAILVAFLAVATAVMTGAVMVPPALASVAPYAGLVVVALTAFLPRIQTETGPGAAPLLSPPKE